MTRPKLQINTDLEWDQKVINIIIFILGIGCLAFIIYTKFGVEILHKSNSGRDLVFIKFGLKSCRSIKLGLKSASNIKLWSRSCEIKHRDGKGDACFSLSHN